MLQARYTSVIPNGMQDRPLPIGAGLNVDQWFLPSDLDLAVAVQRNMLPRSAKRLKSARYTGFTAAARGVGGDYYDFLDLGPNSLGVLLADVSGKGVPAALLTANLQALIRCECHHDSNDLCAMLQRVNAHFFQSTLPAQYATLFFGRYDDRTRRLHYVNCGQQPVIVMRRDRTIEVLNGTALPVGLLEEWSGEVNTVGLHRGDVLCVCSDGVVEAGLENGNEFGVDGLLSVLTTSPQGDICPTVARIAQAMRVYAATGLTDDTTIVGLQSV